MNFDYSLLDVTAHRPWPMPETPWILTQSWHDLLFAHWPVDADLLRRRMPPELPPDLHDGRAWLGVVPFDMTNVAPRGVPALPVVSAFPELNVRTYVTVEGKPGVYFFSLDAASGLAVRAARLVFNLPYHTADMRVEPGAGGWVEFRSRRRGAADGAAEFTARYRPTGPPEAPQPGTLEHFLTERYCLYAVDRRSRPCRLEIHHRPWPLQTAECEISVNTMAKANGLTLPEGPPIVHFAKRQDMVAWMMTRL